MNRAQAQHETRQTILANSLLLDLLRQLGRNPYDVIADLVTERADETLARAVDAGVIVKAHGETTCGACGADAPAGQSDAQLVRLGWDVLPVAEGRLFRVCPPCATAQLG